VRTTVAIAAVAIAASGFQTAGAYAMVTTELGLPATFLGVALSAQGAGSIVGGLFAGRLITRRGPVAAAAIGAAAFAISGLIRCLPWWPATVGASVIAGVGLPWTLIAAVTVVQTHTPTELLGRVSATANTAMFGPIALAIPLGSAAVTLGARVPLLLGAALCLGTAAGSLRRWPARPGSSG
jgi:MFS family permease